MEQKIDALRVVQDPQYAAGLSESQWRILANDPVWNELVGEFHEMTAPVIALYAAQLGQAAPRPRTAQPPGGTPGASGRQRAAPVRRHRKAGSSPSRSGYRHQPWSLLREHAHESNVVHADAAQSVSACEGEESRYSES